MRTVARGQGAQLVEGLGLPDRLGQVQRGVAPGAGEDGLGDGGGHELLGGGVPHRLEHLFDLGRSGADVPVGEDPGGRARVRDVRRVSHGDLLVTGPM